MDPAECSVLDESLRRNHTDIPSTKEEYLFIHGMDNRYSASVRAHVLQKHWHKRKVGATSQRPRAKKKDYSEKDRARVQEARSPSTENDDISRHDIQLPDWIVEMNSPYSRRPRQASSFAAMIDVNYSLNAFGPYYKDLSDFEKQMVNYYSFADYFFYNSTSPFNLCPGAECGLRVNLSDTLIITAMIAYSCARLESLGICLDRAKSLHYYIRFCKELSHRLRLGLSSTTSIQMTIIAVSGIWNLYRERFLFSTEDQEKLEAEKHLDGMRNLIVLAGGWYNCCSGVPWLSWMLHWTDICTAGALSFGMSLSQDVPLLAADTKQSYQYGTARTEAEQKYLEGFIDAYQNFYLAAVHKTKLAIKALRTEYIPLLDLLQPTAYTYSLLVRDQQAGLRSAVVAFYANIVESTAMMNLPGNPTVEKRASPKIRNLSNVRTIEAILWNFVTDEGTNRFIDSEWANSLSRLLWVEARLPGELRERLARNLLDFVTYSQPWPDALKSWWTPQELRTAVQVCFQSTST